MPLVQRLLVSIFDLTVHRAVTFVRQRDERSPETTRDSPFRGDGKLTVQ
jgi:hypothetical protein